MSSNRSVQAAQRRRAGPAEPPVQTRYPQPSINSAQAFANQARPGPGPNIPIGRLAAQQHSTMSQQQQQQQQQQSTAKDITSGVTKMTIHQAITLITLRLGSVESKIMHLEYEGSQQQQQDSQQQDSQQQDSQQQDSGYSNENMVLIDKSVIELITNRIESLEKRSSVSTSSGPEVAVLKQQLEAIKPILIQTKNASATVIKENKDLKMQVDSLRQELNETKELLQTLQNVTVDNSQKILSMSMSMSMDNNLFLEDYEEEGDEDEVEGEKEVEDEGIEVEDEVEVEGKSFMFNILNETRKNESIYGTNLKELIENEINLNSTVAITSTNV
jgi:hypothetical protein